MLALGMGIQRKADGLAFLAGSLPAVAHLVDLAGLKFVNFPVLVANLVEDSPLDSGLVFLVVLSTAAGGRSAVVFTALFCDFLETLLPFLFKAFAVAQLVFLVAGAL